jgi:hypothetical protein
MVQICFVVLKRHPRGGISECPVYIWWWWCRIARRRRKSGAKSHKWKKRGLTVRQGACGDETGWVSRSQWQTHVEKWQVGYLDHKSLRCPVTRSMTDLGPGPMASTVCDPAGIWVRPASHTMYVGKSREAAVDASSSYHAIAQTVYNVWFT